MTTSPANIADQAERLPVVDRIKLVERLLESLDKSDLVETGTANFPPLDGEGLGGGDEGQVRNDGTTLIPIRPPSTPPRKGGEFTPHRSSTRGNRSRATRGRDSP